MEFPNLGTWQVSALGRWNDATEVRQVYQLRNLTGSALTQEEGFEDIMEWVETLLTILTAVQTTLLIWRGITINTLDGAEASGQLLFDTPLDGAATDDPLPPGVAVLQYMPTQYSRRQLRKYIPGLTEAAIGPFGGFGSGTVATIAGTHDHYLDVFTATNGSWGFGHALPFEGDEFAYPISVTTSANPSYQRRRRVGRGI